ncbi:hypothetical protein FACS1894127_3910 [Clostridia bacterium]|nr:hypothetical protein FACS1894127_3910 [Clostridia bacterium]
MKLELNKSELTIMGIPFDNKRDFRGVWHALSTNMFEGWEPNRDDVLRLKERVAALREEANVSKTV